MTKPNKARRFQDAQEWCNPRIAARRLEMTSKLLRTLAAEHVLVDGRHFTLVGGAGFITHRYMYRPGRIRTDLKGWLGQRIREWKSRGKGLWKEHHADCTSYNNFLL